MNYKCICTELLLIRDHSLLPAFLQNYRKICRNCKCGQEEHDVLLSNEEDRKVGRLFEDTKYTTLIAKLKSDGVPLYKRNVMILTSPVAAKKNVSINTVTYEWAPPVHSQALVGNKARGLPRKVPGLLTEASSSGGLIHLRSVFFPGFSVL